MLERGRILENLGKDAYIYRDGRGIEARTNDGSASNEKHVTNGRSNTNTRLLLGLLAECGHEKASNTWIG